MKTPEEKLADFISADPLTAEEADFVILALLHLRQIRKVGMRPQSFRFYYGIDVMSDAIPVPQSAAEIEKDHREWEKRQAREEGKKAGREEAKRTPPEGPRAK